MDGPTKKPRQHDTTIEMIFNQCLANEPPSMQELCRVLEQLVVNAVACNI